MAEELVALDNNHCGALNARFSAFYPPYPPKILTTEPDLKDIWKAVFQTPPAGR